MKLSSFLIALIALLPLSCSAGLFSNKKVNATGPDITGSIEANNITEIVANQAIIVNYTVGPAVSVSYTAPESLLKYLEITSTAGKLKCKFQDGVTINFNNRHVVVEVTAPAVTDFTATSAADINVYGYLNVDELELDCSSAGKINIARVSARSVDIDTSSASTLSIQELNTESLEIDSSSAATTTIKGTLGNVEVDASSASTVTLSGKCQSLDLEVSSAAKVNGSKLTALTGELNASSGGRITVLEATQTPYSTKKSSGGVISIQ